MRKKIVALLMVAMVATLAGCGSSGTKETKKAEEKKPTYESVYKEYSQKMKDATPGLIEEYKKDAEGVSDMNKLANICTKKTEKLASICTKGGKRLASIHLEEKDDEEKYNEWMNKLTDVYQDEAQKITDAYQDSVLG
jgi:predicted small lipoprotein YifL